MFVKFISAFALAILATVCIAILATPYYFARQLFIEGYDGWGWTLTGFWTFVLMFVSFWNIIGWMKKGKEQKQQETEG